MKSFVIAIKDNKDIDRLFATIHTMIDKDRELFVELKSYGKEDLEI